MDGTWMPSRQKIGVNASGRWSLYAGRLWIPSLFPPLNYPRPLPRAVNAGVFFTASLRAGSPGPCRPRTPVLQRGDDASILAELSADDQVATAMLSRKKNRVLNCPHFTLRAGAPEGRSRTKPPKTCLSAFNRIWNAQICAQSSARCWTRHFTATPPLELVWKFAGDWWHLVDIVARPFQWFRFNSKNEPVFVGEYGSYCAEPISLPPGKFVFVTHHATYDNPYGLAPAFPLFVAGKLQARGFGFMPVLSSGTGCSWVVGMAPSQASEDDKRRIARDLSRMVQDAVAVVPYGSEIKLGIRGPDPERNPREVPFPAGQGDFQDSRGPDADSRDGGQEQPGGGADPQRSGRGAGGFPTRLWSLTHGMK